MCYDIASATLAKLKYAQHRADDPEYIKQIEDELKKISASLHPYYTVNGFAHPGLLVFTNHQPYLPQVFSWGLIPSWSRSLDEAIACSQLTINARGETIFTKPTFKKSARFKRCLVYADGFFEYFHFNKQAYPFFIKHPLGDPLIFAGLWDEWVDQSTGVLYQTCTIVTTVANPLLKKIHVKPGLEEARMPVILNKSEQDIWLQTSIDEQDWSLINPLLKPYSDQLLAHTVKKLKGKQAPGNSPEAIMPFEYPELALLGI